MSASVTFDHLAIGVRDWPAGFRRFASELAGGEVRVERMPPDEATGIPVWLVAEAAPERAR